MMLMAPGRRPDRGARGSKRYRQRRRVSQPDAPYCSGEARSRVVRRSSCCTGAGVGAAAVVAAAGVRPLFPKRPQAAQAKRACSVATFERAPRGAGSTPQGHACADRVASAHGLARTTQRWRWRCDHQGLKSPSSPLPTRRPLLVRNPQFEALLALDLLASWPRPRYCWLARCLLSWSLRSIQTRHWVAATPMSTARSISATAPKNSAAALASRAGTVGHTIRRPTNMHHRQFSR